MQDKVLDRIVRDIYNKKKKVIGWGAGGYFLAYNNLFKLDLEYIIDSDPNKCDKTIDRFIIKNPEALKNEDINETVIVIYSTALNPIINQIKKNYGDFFIIQAPLLFGYNLVKDKRKLINEIIDNGNGEKKKYSSDMAIVIQGPVYDEITLEIVKYYAALYQKDCIILSTWKKTNPEIIKELTKYVDYCILNEEPEYGGEGNRNYQIVSTFEGLKKAKELGLKYVLKTRSDMLISSENILNQCLNLQKLYEDDGCNKYGAKGRIIVTSSYTCKHKPYFVTDFALFGYIDDMMKYWGIPLETVEKEKEFVLYPPEMHFGRKYCENVGWYIKETVDDWWEYCEKFFIVVDDKWFDLLWYKHPIIPSAIDTDKSKECISHYFWQGLYFRKVNNKSFE